MTEATLAFHTMDVFTDTPFAGNPLAIAPGTTFRKVSVLLGKRKASALG